MKRNADTSVLVTGRAGMDFYAEPVGTPIAEATQFFAGLGGSSANIAAALGVQGQRVAFLSVLSEDPVGRFCARALESYGVETSPVAWRAGDPRTSLAVVDTRGDQTEAVIYRNNAVDLTLDGDAVALDLAPYDTVVATGTALVADPSRSATLSLLRRAKAEGLETVIDLDYRAYSWGSLEEAAAIYNEAAEACDIVVGNDDEFAVFGGSYDNNLASARALAGKGKMVVFKMGSKGAVVITPEGEVAAGVYRVDALKPTGAGDSFLGGFLSARRAGLPLKTCLSRGAATAAIVVSRVGCAPAMPTPAEIDDFIQNHPGASAPPEV